MELTQQSLLEELIMSPNLDNDRTPFPNDFCLPAATYPSLVEIISPQEFGNPCHFQPFLEALNFPDQFTSFYDIDDTVALPFLQEEYATKVENREIGFLDNYALNNFDEDGMSSFKVVSGQVDDNRPNINIIDVKSDLRRERKSTLKKPNGQPSKNLMAERKRRKRLNDRLSMLRSIVPKISKMDRTSILGDTIDYTRELLEKIRKLREEGIDENLNQINVVGNYVDRLKPNEMLVRNPPKFDVERGINDTRVEVCCSAKQGLLISTISTLDALGLDIQQCVISCFNDFSLQASCYEVAEHRSLVNVEDVKQALFINAGYGGRCL